MKNKQLAENLFYVLFGICFFALTVRTTYWYYNDIIYFVIEECFVLCMTGIMLYGAFHVLSVVLNAYRNHTSLNLTKVLLQTGLLVVTYVGYMIKGMGYGELEILLMTFFCVAADGKNPRSILKLGLRIGIGITVVAFVCSMAGFISNNRGNSFGYIYRTDYACHLLFLLLSYLFLQNGKLTFHGELGMVLLFAYNWFLVGGKTTDICILVAMYGTYWNHYRREGMVPFQKNNPLIAFLFRLIYFPCVMADRMLSGRKLLKNRKPLVEKLYCASFLLFAVSTIGITLCYHLLPQPFMGLLSKFGSLRARLLLGIVGFDVFPINLFGSHIYQHGYGGAESAVDFYYFLDISYVKLLLENGLLALTILLLIMTLLQVKLSRHGMHYRMFLMAIVALDCAIEHHMANLSFNVFGLLLFTDFVYLQQESSSSGIKAEVTLTPIKKALVTTYIIISLIIGIPAFQTAHTITNFHVQEPKTAALVVVPGSYFDGYVSEDLVTLRGNAAAMYLRYHKEDCCVISGAERLTVYRILTEHNISSARIYLDDTSNTLTDALAYADELIQNNQLVSRKAICTFGTEQARASAIAHDMGTPLNGISVELNGLQYCYSFVREQGAMFRYWLGGLSHEA